MCLPVTTRSETEYSLSGSSESATNWHSGRAFFLTGTKSSVRGPYQQVDCGVTCHVVHLFTLAIKVSNGDHLQSVYLLDMRMFRRQVCCGLPAIRGVRAATFKRRSNFLKWWRFGDSKPAMVWIGVLCHGSHGMFSFCDFKGVALSPTIMTPQSWHTKNKGILRAYSTSIVEWSPLSGLVEFQCTSDL